MIKNKNLRKFILEISKIDQKLELFDELNSFQAQILKFLFKNKKVKNSFIFKNVKSDLSRAQKYRAYKILLDKKYIIKKNNETFLYSK